MEARFEGEFFLLNDAEGEGREMVVALAVTTRATDVPFEVQRLISGAKVLTNGPDSDLYWNAYIKVFFCISFFCSGLNAVEADPF